MRRTHLAIAALVAIVAAIVIWKLRSGADDESGSATAGGASSDPAQLALGAVGNPASSTAPAWLGGRVTRAADGAGIAGATVAVAREQLVPMMRGDDQPPAIVTTDASGAWSMPSLAPGTYSIAATATGLIPATRMRVAIAAGARMTVDLALATGGSTLSGTVTDVGGGPIGGARVTARRSSMMFRGGRAELVAITDAEGRYQLTLADGDYNVIASHDDYTRAFKMFELRGAPATLDFVLVPGSTIRGVVVTRDGKPVPGATVRSSGTRSLRDLGREAKADEHGAFALTGLGSGAIKLTASAKGLASRDALVVELGVGEHVDGVRIVVDRALSISGRVVRAGKPAEGIAGVLVGIFSIGAGGVAMSEPSDATGAFEIHGVKPASYTLFAYGEGNVPDVGKPIEVADKDITGVVVELQIGATLSGRVEPGVIASLGLEVDIAKIGIANMFQAMKVMVVQAESDATGAFTLEAAPPGEYTIVATTVDGKRGKLPVVITAADQTGLIVKLEPRASIAGKVVDERGAPVAGVRVDASAGEKRGGISFGSARGESGAVTGTDGSFKLVGLESGKLGLTVADERGRIPWASGKRDEPHKVELAKAQELTGVMLAVEARDGVIRGVVVHADRSPAPDSWVTVRPDFSAAGKERRRDMMMSIMSPGDPILTGEDGTFSIPRLRRGTYEVHVEGPKGASRASKTGVKTGETVIIVLESLGSISGRVTLAGAPVTEFDLGCRGGMRGGMRFGGDDPMGRRFTSTDGTYTIERLSPGEYTCTVTSNGGTANGKIVVAAGPAKLDLAIAGWATITGVAVDALDGKPLPNLAVLVSAEGIEGQAFADLMAGKGPTTDANGRFTVDRVPIGKGTVHIAPKDASFNHLASREYTATAGQRVDLGTIKLVPPKPDGGGTLGFFAAVAETKLVIVDVKSDTPADRAGVLVGDKIISIDGRPVSDIGADVAKQLLAPGTLAIGQRVQLGLEREGKQVPVVLIAEKF